MIGLLAKRREVQDEERVKLGGNWPTVGYDGEHLDLVFTTATGSPMLRQHVDRAIRAPVASSVRVAVFHLGSRLPASNAAMFGRATPLRASSSACVNPAAVLALRSTSANLMYVS